MDGDLNFLLHIKYEEKLDEANTTNFFLYSNSMEESEHYQRHNDVFAYVTQSLKILTEDMFCRSSVKTRIL